MADLKALEDRLKEIGCNFRYWGRAEIKELAHVLLPGETVELCINGQYEGGFALLVATDQRVLLIDKKPMYLTLEDIRYDMMAEVDYNHRLMNASIFIVTPSKSLRFVAYNNARLRKFFHYVQQRVMEIRQHYQHLQEYQQYAQVAQPTPIPEAVQIAQVAQAKYQPFLEAEKQTAMPFEIVVERPADPIVEAEAAPQPVQYSQAGQLSELPAQRVQGQTPAQPVYSGYHRTQHAVAPIISAYTRLPMMSRQRRFLGSKAMSRPMSGPTRLS